MLLEHLETRSVLDGTYHNLAGGNFSQDWSNESLITANDDWSGVPSIIGYRGDGLTGGVLDTDPRTILVDGSGTPVDVLANLSNPSGTATGGVAEFHGPVNSIAMQGGSPAFDAPHLVLHVNSTGRENLQLSFLMRDLDGLTDNAIQQLNVQYRIGATGDYTNVPGGYVPDASVGPNLTIDQPFSVTLPAAVNNQAQVQVRILTTNATGNDEWIGIDDIVVSSTAINTPPTVTVTQSSITVPEGTFIGNGGTFQDLDGNTVTLSISPTPAGANFNYTPGPGPAAWNWDYTIPDDMAGTLFTVTANDGLGGTATATFTVTGTNAPPTATDNTYFGTEDLDVTGNVITDGPADSDLAGANDPLTVTLVNGAAFTPGVPFAVTNGMLTMATDGSFTFDPAANVNGVFTSFTYTISDGDTGTGTGNVSFNLASVPDAPTITAPAHAISQVILYNRSDCCQFRLDDVRIDIYDDANQVVWTSPTQDVNGAASFVVDVSALNGGTPVAGQTVRVTLLTSSEPLSLAEVQVVTTLLANAAVGKPATQSSNYPFGGGASNAVDGNTDGDWGSGSVTHTNDSPLDVDPWWQVDLGAAPVIVNEGALATNGGTFSDADSPAVTIVGPGTINQDVGVPSGNWSWSQLSGNNGISTITINATSNDGGDTVFFDLIVLNIAPIAQDDTFTTLEDNDLFGNVISNTNPNGADSDPVDTLTVDQINGAGFTAGVPVAIFGGLLTMFPNGNFQFDPALDFFGTAGFTYRVTDGDATDDASVTINVTNQNDAPVVAPNTPLVTVSETQTATMNGTLSDVDTSPLSSIGLSASIGSVTNNGDGTWSWSYGTTDDILTPGQTVTITADDGAGGSSFTTFQLIVNNLPPNVNSLSANTSLPGFREQALVNLSGGATDPAGAADPLTYSWVVTGPNGFSVNLPGLSVSFTPPDNGSYSYTLTADDGDGGTDSFGDTVTVANVDPTIDTFIVPGSGVEGTAVNLSATSSDVAGAADPLTFTWTVTGPGGFAATLTGATPSFTPPDNGTYVVTLVVDDGDSGTDTDTANVIVSNLNPTIVSVAPTTSPPHLEGSLVTMTANVTDPAGANDPITYTWRATGPNGFDTGSIVTSSATFPFTPDDQGTFIVTLSVDDGDSGTAGPTTTNVVVVNVPPDAAISDPNFTDPIATGQSIDFVLNAFDVSSVDQGQNFSWQIDWDGNGTWDQTVSGPDGAIVSHVFPVIGNFTIRVRSTDHDVPVTYGPVSTLDVNVSNIFLDSNGNLVIGGTVNSDIITITPDGPGGVKVVYNRVPYSLQLDPGARIFVYGGAGSDRLTVSDKVFYPVEGYGGIGNDTFLGGSGDDTFYGEAGNDSLMGNVGNDTLYGGDNNDTCGGLAGNDYVSGGAGNDTVTGGNDNDTVDGGEGNDRVDGGFGNDVLFGGANNDTLSGSYGNDIILGGDGNDRINGNQDHDVLIGEQGADLIYGDGGDDALLAGTASATDPGNYSTPEEMFLALADIAATWPGDMQGAIDLLGTIEDNDSVDTLYGGLGVDWFFVSSLRQIKDLKTDDQWFLV